MHDKELVQFLSMLVIALVAARLAAELCERVRIPAVLGELLVGLLLGPSILGVVNINDHTLTILAEIGAILLLFEIGLETDLGEMARVGIQSTVVAVIGVIAPAVFGIAISLMAGFPIQTAIFVGAAMTATSVGITARVMSDMGILHWRESRIVLGAAVVDDVLGLLILAIVSGMAKGQGVSFWAIGQIFVIAFLFLSGSLYLGLKIAPWLLNVARRMRARATLATAALALCFSLSALAQKAGLAPIVGAFAAGAVAASSEHRLRIHERISAVADLFIPLFFVYMGAKMDLGAMLHSLSNLTSALFVTALLVAAIIGKLLSGLPVLRGQRWLLVAVGMVPRGEVGMIFADIGHRVGVFGDALYTELLTIFVITTIVTPLWLRLICARYQERAASAVS